MIHHIVYDSCTNCPDGKEHPPRAPPKRNFDANPKISFMTVKVWRYHSNICISCSAKVTLIKNAQFKVNDGPSVPKRRLNP